MYELINVQNHERFAPGMLVEVCAMVREELKREVVALVSVSDQGVLVKRGYAGSGRISYGTDIGKADWEIIGWPYEESEGDQCTDR